MNIDLYPDTYNKMNYNIELLIDPCKNNDPGCCMDNFGDPEYIRQPYKRRLGFNFALSISKVSLIGQLNTIANI